MPEKSVLSLSLSKAARHRSSVASRRLRKTQMQIPLDRNRIDILKCENYVMESCVRERAPAPLSFWPAVHGGLGRARRPRGGASCDALPSTALASTASGLREPTRTAVACVRFSAAPRPDGAAYQIASRLACFEGRCSLRAAWPASRAYRWERCDRPYSTCDKTCNPWHRAAEAVLVRRPGDPPVAASAAAAGGDREDIREREDPMPASP
jgi:hypothetical protein